jgi:hypothetical protein
MKFHSTVFLILFALSTFIPSICRAEGEVFWEAEDASDTNMKTDGPYRPLTPQEVEKISGGKWFNGRVGDEALFAEYPIKVPTAGTYQFYTRKYWQHGAFRWRVDDGAWHDVTKVDLLDTVVIREYVPISWVQLDSVTLTAGNHTIRIEVVNDPTYQFSKTYGFDCFLLTPSQLSDFVQSHPGISGELK